LKVVVVHRRFVRYSKEVFFAGAWFILTEAVYRQSKDLQELGLKMLDWMWARGWDSEHGGLFYFRQRARFICAAR
jgi:hypothetical protein